MTKENTLAVKQKQIKTLLNGDDFRQQVEAALPAHLEPERFIRICLTAMNRTPALANCTQVSLFQCLLDLSAAGLEPDGRRAHLIPYGQQCTLVIDYKGLVELALRNGDISTIHADVVCENDAFTYDLGEVREHKIDFRQPRGEVVAAYVRVVKKDGSIKSEVMSKEEIDAVRADSKAGKSGPWVNHYNEMAKKTVFRRCTKWLILSPEIKEHLESDDKYLFGDMKRMSAKQAANPLFRKIAQQAQIEAADTAQTIEAEAVKGDGYDRNIPATAGKEDANA